MDAQMKDMATQMEALDDFVTKARSQNGRYLEAHLENLNDLASNVRESYSSLHDHFTGFGDRVRGFHEDAITQKDTVQESIAPLSEEVRKPLTELQANIRNAPLIEYTATGETPPKRKYEYPTTLPQTEAHETLIKKMRKLNDPAASPFGGEDFMAPIPGPVLGSPSKRSPIKGSPSKTRVYNDAEDEVGTLPPPTSTATSANTGLREVDINVAVKPLASSSDSSSAANLRSSMGPKADLEKDDPAPPPSKKQLSTSVAAESKLPQKTITRKMAGMAEGRENVPPPMTGRRTRSGRLSG